MSIQLLQILTVPQRKLRRCSGKRKIGQRAGKATGALHTHLCWGADTHRAVGEEATDHMQGPAQIMPLGYRKTLF